MPLTRAVCSDLDSPSFPFVVAPLHLTPSSAPGGMDETPTRCLNLPPLSLLFRTMRKFAQKPTQIMSCRLPLMAAHTKVYCAILLASAATPKVPLATCSALEGWVDPSITGGQTTKELVGPKRAIFPLFAWFRGVSAASRTVDRERNGCPPFLSVHSCADQPVHSLSLLLLSFATDRVEFIALSCSIKARTCQDRLWPCHRL